MLYATTRDPNDVHTVYKTVHTDCAPDGGLYIPFRFPVWEQGDILAMAERSFSQNVAHVLNQFFSAELTGWDVDFALGRNPVVLQQAANRVTIAECWHNARMDFDYAVQMLSDKLRKEEIGKPACNWTEIAIAISFLAGIYGAYIREDPNRIQTPVDVAISTGSFAMPMAGWYARAMGMNIGNIVCGCNANGGVWDLLHLGEISTGALAHKTVAPEADYTVPRNLERLIHATLGVEETRRYLQYCQAGKVYGPGSDKLDTLRRGMFAAVISDSRVKTLIPGIYSTNSYIYGPYSILAYASLMDYRAKTGESRPAIVLCQRSPMRDGEFVAECMGMSLLQLQRVLA